MATAIVNLFFSPGCVFWSCVGAHEVGYVWISADLFCVSVAIAIVFCVLFASGSVCCLVEVLTGFVNVWISANGFVLCVGGHSYRKYIYIYICFPSVRV